MELVKFSPFGCYFSRMEYKLISDDPPRMRSRSDNLFTSQIDRYIADHAAMSSRHRNWFVNETDLFETSL